MVPFAHHCLELVGACIIKHLVADLLLDQSLFTLLNIFDKSIGFLFLVDNFDFFVKLESLMSHLDLLHVLLSQLSLLLNDHELVLHVLLVLLNIPLVVLHLLHELVVDVLNAVGHILLPHAARLEFKFLLLLVVLPHLVNLLVQLGQPLFKLLLVAFEQVEAMLLLLLLLLLKQLDSICDGLVPAVQFVDFESLQLVSPSVGVSDLSVHLLLDGLHMGVVSLFLDSDLVDYLLSLFLLLLFALLHIRHSLNPEPLKQVFLLLGGLFEVSHVLLEFPLCLDFLSLFPLCIGVHVSLKRLFKLGICDFLLIFLGS